MEDRDDFDRMLAEPAPGQRAAPTVEDVQAELADFGAFMAAVTG